MRKASLAVLATLSLSALCRADRLIEMPIAPKVRKGVLRTEFISERGNSQRGFLQYGLDQSIEIGMRFEDWKNKRQYSADFSYQVIPPAVDLAPGIAFGVQDIFDKGQDGRRFFGVITWRFANEGDGMTFLPGELTLGASYHRSLAPIAGVSLPLFPYLKLMFEHDSYRLNAAAEIKASRSLSFRWVQRGETPGLSLRYQVKF